MDNPIPKPEVTSPASESAHAENQPSAVEIAPNPLERTPNFSGTSNAPSSSATTPVATPAVPVPASKGDEEDSLAHLDSNQKASVQASVNKAFNEDVSKGVDSAVKTGNPAIVDAVHDTLDKEEFHEALIQKNKVDVP